MREIKRVIVAGSAYIFLLQQLLTYFDVKSVIYFKNCCLVYFFCNYIYANETNGVPCGQEELQRCASQLRAVSATNEFNFVYNKDQLEKICP